MLIMLKTLYHHLVTDNPAWMYLSARTWRSFRRWGWFLALLSLGLIAFAMLADGLAVLEGGYPTMLIIKLFPMMVLMAWVTLFCVSGLKKLLHPHNVEPLFLSRIAPAQIWAAVMLQLNRNLLVVYCISLPVILAPGPALLVSLSHVLWIVFVLHCICNVLGLVCCVLSMQLGLRGSWLLLGAGCVGYLYLTGEASVGSQPVPLLVLISPIYHLGRLFGIYGANVNAPIFFGNSLPYGAMTIITLLVTATGLILWLISGPLHLPAASAEEIARVARQVRSAGFSPFVRLFTRLGVALETSLASFTNPNRYSWPYTMSRIYENSPCAIRRRPYLWSVIATTAVYWIALVLLVDHLGEIRLGLFNLQSDDRGYILAMAFMGFGLLASFRFCFAGKAESSDQLASSLKWRTAAFALMVVPALCLVWIHPPLRRFDLMMVYAIAIVLLQSLLALFFSLHSIWQRQATGIALAHLMGMMILPFLALMVIDLLNQQLYVILFSPPVAMAALGELTDFGKIFYYTGFLGLFVDAAYVLPLVEILLLTFLLLRCRRRLGKAALGQTQQTVCQGRDDLFVQDEQNLSVEDNK